MAQKAAVFEDSLSPTLYGTTFVRELEPHVRKERALGRQATRPQHHHDAADLRGVDRGRGGSRRGGDRAIDDSDPDPTARAIAPASALERYTREERDRGIRKRRSGSSSASTENSYGFSERCEARMRRVTICKISNAHVGHIGDTPFRSQLERTALAVAIRPDLRTARDGTA